MKVCTKCGEINNDNNLICINCNASNKFFIDYDKAISISQKNIDMKNKIKKNILLILSIISISLILLLLFLNFRNQTLSLNLIFKTIMLIITGFILIFYAISNLIKELLKI